MNDLCLHKSIKIELVIVSIRILAIPHKDHSTHALIQNIFIEHLMYLRYCFKYLVAISEQNGEKYLLHRAYSLEWGDRQNLHIFLPKVQTLNI